MALVADVVVDLNALELLRPDGRDAEHEHELDPALALSRRLPLAVVNPGVRLLPARPEPEPGLAWQDLRQRLRPGTTLTTAREVNPPNGPPTIVTVIVWVPGRSGRTSAE